MGIALIVIDVLPTGLALHHARAIPDAAVKFVYTQLRSAVYGVSDFIFAARSSWETPETVLLMDVLWLHRESGMMGVAAFLLSARSSVATRITELRTSRDAVGWGAVGECRGDGNGRRTDATGTVEGESMTRGGLVI